MTTMPSYPRIAIVMRLFRFSAMVALGLSAPGCGARQQVATREPTPARDKATTFHTVDGREIAAAELDALIPELMARRQVTGLQLVIVDGGRIAYSRGFGLRDRGSGAPVDARTTFWGASLSKTVFAYLVMHLVDDGVLDLDRPLHTYLDKPLWQYPLYRDLQEDERYKRITARLALSHQTGWPNTRYDNPDQKLDFKFDPGTSFRYSGEGIGYLQFVIEEVTGKGLDQLSLERVFEPLAMTRTRYMWDDSFNDNYAIGHRKSGEPIPFNSTTAPAPAAPWRPPPRTTRGSWSPSP